MATPSESTKRIDQCGQSKCNNYSNDQGLYRVINEYCQTYLVRHKVAPCPGYSTARLDVTRQITAFCLCLPSQMVM